MDKNTRGYRNITIELLRIVAMLLILACHSAIHLNWGLMSTNGWSLALANMIVQCGQLGVALFFMITGYFFVKRESRYSKLVGIWSQLFVYGLLCLSVAVIARAFGTFQSLDEHFVSWGLATTLKKELMPITSYAYWFMTAYFCVILLSPFLNTIVHRMREKMVLGLTGMLAISGSFFLVGWTFVPLNWCTKAITCYLVGATMPMWRKLFDNNWLKTIIVTIVCLSCLVVFNYAAKSGNELVAWFGWKGFYHDGPWPLWILPAALLLNMATKSRWTPSSRVAAVVTLFSSATFGVYLLHENYLGYRMLWTVVNKYVPAPQYAFMKVIALPLLVVTLFLVLAFMASIIDRLIVLRVKQQTQLLFERYVRCRNDD